MCSLPGEGTAPGRGWQGAGGGTDSCPPHPPCHIRVVTVTWGEATRALWGTAHTQGTTRIICGAPLPGEPSGTPITISPGWQGTLTQSSQRSWVASAFPQPHQGDPALRTAVYPTAHPAQVQLSAHCPGISPHSGVLRSLAAPCPSQGASPAQPGPSAPQGWLQHEASRRVKRAWVIPPISVSENHKRIPHLLVQVGESPPPSLPPWAGGYTGAQTPSSDFPGADQVRQAAAWRGDLQHQRAGGG